MLTGIPAYLILPGLLLQILFFRKLNFGLNTFLYAIGLSISFWTFGGLLLNTLLPLIGIDRPLQLTLFINLLISVTLLCVITFNRRLHDEFEINTRDLIYGLGLE